MSNMGRDNNLNHCSQQWDKISNLLAMSAVVSDYAT